MVLIRQIGELSILDEDVNYIDGGSDTVYNHLLNALNYLAKNLGSHNLCLIGDGDWTDPMNGVGRQGKGESTWSTLAFIYCIENMLEIIRFKSDRGTERNLLKIKDQLDNAVNTYCWDGEWYAAGFDDEGNAVGNRNDSNRIFLNAQTWAIITGTPKGERLSKVLHSIERLNTPFGPLLLDPPFSEWDPRWGRISIKKAGTTENGSVYCHASMFKSLGDCIAGKGHNAFETISKTLPTNPENPVECSLQLPLFVPNYYFGLKDSQNYGRSSGHQSTGTVAWMMWVTLEHILGIKATIEGLVVNPCIPGEWKEFYVGRRYKAAKYEIYFMNPEGVTSSVKFILVDNYEIDGNILPYKAGKTFHVTVIMG